MGQKINFMTSTPTLGLPLVDWREVGETPSNLRSPINNQTCPSSGETRWTKIHNYHRTPIGGRVWLLYRPTLSWLNGWEEHPHELDESALIECEVQSQHETEWHFEKEYKSRYGDAKSRATIEELEKQGIIFPMPPDDEYRGHAQVLCHRIVPFVEIPNHFPETKLQIYPVFTHDTITASTNTWFITQITPKKQWNGG